MTNLDLLYKGYFRKIRCINTPKNESFVVCTVQYKAHKCDTLVYKSGSHGEVQDYLSVYQFKCTNINEAIKRHEIICTLLRQGNYCWLNKHDIYFN